MATTSAGNALKLVCLATGLLAAAACERSAAKSSANGGSFMIETHAKNGKTIRFLLPRGYYEVPPRDERELCRYQAGDKTEHIALAWFRAFKRKSFREYVDAVWHGRYRMGLRSDTWSDLPTYRCLPNGVTVGEFDVVFSGSSGAPVIARFVAFAKAQVAPGRNYLLKVQTRATEDSLSVARDRLSALAAQLVSELDVLQ